MVDGLSADTGGCWLAVEEGVVVLLQAETAWAAVRSATVLARVVRCCVAVAGWQDAHAVHRTWVASLWLE